MTYDPNDRRLQYAAYGLKLGGADCCGMVACLCCAEIFDRMATDGTDTELRTCFGIGFREAYRTDGAGQREFVVRAVGDPVAMAGYSDFCDRYADLIYC